MLGCFSLDDFNFNRLMIFIS
ncbi:hypothetical protein DBS1_20526 [Escherichia coli]|nr:hypothetical protein DBS1_20526 [Escherichia coli]